ncbi:hypothetical protein IX296_001890 [Bacteroides pyogenes]|nr:hypothetical protein [Bacteroides pyogenes]MBR8738870.1 hypothetical protein [Bacteroides pyogenes]MBR8754722.1 hypothetical protein [Bacteroides pyogenes]MBR8796152.1 hypothetical protein [Bacteroides pyogenes]MBR8809597.1 hypothetical protein [Bacteroides pyogenes]
MLKCKGHNLSLVVLLLVPRLSLGRKLGLMQFTIT